MSLEAPYQQVIERNVPAVATATTTTTAIGEAQVAGVVSAVAFAPAAAITGAATNTRAVSLINTGQAGAGTTVVATLEFDSGINGVANDDKAITLSATAASLVVAPGDVLVWTSAAVGTGLASPGGLVTVTITRS